MSDLNPKAGSQRRFDARCVAESTETALQKLGQQLACDARGGFSRPSDRQKALADVVLEYLRVLKHRN